MSSPPFADSDVSGRIPGRAVHLRYVGYAIGFAAFVFGMYALELAGMSRAWIAAIFLLAPVALYASIGLRCRTTDPAEYYVAGRAVPGLYNGMAIGADWMSVASFMGLAGLLYTTGHGGLAYVLGWTGGFCLVAFYLAPYLRKFGQYTIPDFIGERYRSSLARLVALLVAVLCCFMYVVAQIYGVGLVTSRLTGFSFEIGIFVGLGGVLVCSFLGGMRAVTWTQVAQYLILAVAYLVPVIWLSVKQTGVPVPQAVIGYQLQKVTALEKQVLADPREQEVVTAWANDVLRQDLRLGDVEAALAQERREAQQRLGDAIRHGAAPAELRALERELQAVPKDVAAAREAWTRAREASEERARPLAGMPPAAQQFAGDPAGDAQQRAAYDESRLNFIALVFCLMAGTAGLPHVLGRFYTTTTVGEARRSVTWALLAIVLVYVSAPVLAVLLKVEVLSQLVGQPFDALPRWIGDWSRVDPSLLSVTDVNRDGILQLGELKMSGDIMVLATPEIGRMPFVITCMVAAGSLAAALSTADGLLLTTANALTHDLYFKIIDRQAPKSRRVAISKVVLLVIALLAAYIATLKPAEILSLVTPAFSIAASTLFPALVLGIFWKRSNRWGAVAGMSAGLAMTLYYLVTTHPALRGLGLGGAPLWWGIQPGSAGVFGVPVGFAVTVLVSLLTPAPAAAAAFVDEVRRPDSHA